MQTIVRKLLVAFAAILIVAAISACGRSKSGGSGNTENANTPTAAQQQLMFSYAQFTNPVLMRIPADDYSSVQVLAAQTAPLEWWTFIRSNIGCVQQGYAATASAHPAPRVDGYSINGNELESDLERGGLRMVQTYTLTLNPTPWGSISRTFQCLVNTDAMQATAQGQYAHGDLTIPIGQRVCSRWTYANQYQTAVPGQGTAQVFAGTFAYTMKSLVTGANFQGEGTASVKMYLNPDNGQWTITDFELHDPQLIFSALAGAVQTSPAQDTCAGP